MVVCDRSERVLAVGRGVFELSGYRDADLMGNDVVEAGIAGFEDGKDPSALAREWGCAGWASACGRARGGGQEKEITADFFPAYDTDGGLLVALTPGGGVKPGPNSPLDHGRGQPLNMAFTDE